jgi:hypothetical protein
VGSLTQRDLRHSLLLGCISENQYPSDGLCAASLNGRPFYYSTNETLTGRQLASAIEPAEALLAKLWLPKDGQSKSIDADCLSNYHMFLCEQAYPRCMQEDDFGKCSLGGFGNHHL